MKNFPKMPVQLNIWIRPELQRKQFEVIKKVKPGILVLSSDGGRNDAEWDLIYKNREMFEKEVDWECDIYKLYANHNHGMYANAKHTFDFIFSKFDRVLGFEDDQIPSVSYFRFCDELLEKYKDDLRICGITGININGITDSYKSDYFFSRRALLGTDAFWKRTYEFWKNDNLRFIEDEYYESLLKFKLGHNNEYKIKRWKKYYNNGVAEGHICWAEDYYVVQTFAMNQLFIVPTKNLVSCMGIGNDAEHGDILECLPKEYRRIFFIPTHEIVLPLKHPLAIIEDYNYEKQLTLNNNKIINCFIKIKRAILILKYHGIKTLLQKIKKYYNRKSNNLIES